MRETKNFGLLFHGGEGLLLMRAFCDSGVDLYSPCTTGWVITFGGATVAWRAHRQSRASSSTASAEYKAACDVTKDVVGHRHLLEYLHAPQPAVPLFCDNSSAVKAMRNAAGVRNLKEISRHLPYLRSHVDAGEVARPSSLELSSLLIS